MSAPARALSGETELEFLESLRARYEAEGFAFTVSPDPSRLPSFLGSYSPDALAQKPGRNIAIEIKQHPSKSSRWQLQDIRRLFEGHPDWQLAVVHRASSARPPVAVPTATPSAIRLQMNEMRALSGQGHRRPAFIMAWSLLEAAFRAVGGEESGRMENQGRTPGSILQTLAMNGFIAPETERRLRVLMTLRNRIVHGDITAEPSPSDVETVLSAIEEILESDGR